MNNKRLLLLGISIILVFSGWMYPNTPDLALSEPAYNNLITNADQFDGALEVPVHTADTDKLARRLTVASAEDSSIDSEFKELFVAATMGGTNGVRLNPKAVRFVHDYMKDNWEELQAVRANCKPHFKLIENVLADYGLPKDLKYLAVIESNLKTSARSRVGAVGPWQLMPQTARDLGLKVNKKVDERRNYLKSTRAAAAYLKDLYNEFGDWLLVIAAYNSGTPNIYRAIHRSGTRDFWELQAYLPAESRAHVKRFIGAQYYFEGQGSVCTLTRTEAKEQLSGSSMYVFTRNLTSQEQSASKTVTISGKYMSAVIARYCLMDEAVFSRYNPNFDKVMASANNTYEMKLPADKMALFTANKYDILNESVQIMQPDVDSSLAADLPREGSK